MNLWGLRAPDYHRTAARRGGGSPCEVCGRRIDHRTAVMVEVNVAGDIIATAGRAISDLVARDAAPSQGWTYVGVSCARRIGLLPAPERRPARRPAIRSATNWRSFPDLERG